MSKLRAVLAILFLAFATLSVVGAASPIAFADSHTPAPKP